MEPSEDVKLLIDHKNNMYKEIYAMERRIKELKNEISITNKIDLATTSYYILQNGAFRRCSTINRS